MTKKKIKQLFSGNTIDKIQKEIDFLEQILIDTIEEAAVKTIKDIPEHLKPYVKTTKIIHLKSKTKLSFGSIETSYEFPIEKDKFIFEFDIDNINGINKIFTTAARLEEAKKTILTLFDEHLKTYTDYEIFIMFPEMAHELLPETFADIKTSRDTFNEMLDLVDDETVKIELSIKDFYAETEAKGETA